MRLHTQHGVEGGHRDEGECPEGHCANRIAVGNGIIRGISGAAILSRFPFGNIDGRDNLVVAEFFKFTLTDDSHTSSIRHEHDLFFGKRQNECWDS